MIGDYLSLLWGALTQNPSAYEAAATPRGMVLALLILLTGGVSLAMGQSVVLFANRVPARRFLPSLFAGAGFLALAVSLWTLVSWAVVSVFHQDVPALSQMLGVVSLSFAPLVFGMLVLIPYLGNAIFYLLIGWVLVGLHQILRGIFGLTFWQAGLALALGGAVIIFLIYTGVMSWLWQRATGKSQIASGHELAMQLAGELDSPENLDENSI